VIEFEHRAGWVCGTVAVALRTRAKITEAGTFEVPGEVYEEDPDVLQRLIDAGHEPVDPSALPDEVEYEAAETASSADESTSPGDESNGSGGDEAASEAASVPDDELTGMDRSELWELAHSDEFEAEPEFEWNESTTEGLREWIRGQREEE
jgi:hypothetical protein